MKKFFNISLLLIILFFIFKPWFIPGLISSGDMGFLYKSMFSNHILIPYAWYSDQGNGLGGLSAPFLWIYFMGTFPIYIVDFIFGYNWPFIIRFGYLYPFLTIGIVSINLLIKKTYPKEVTYFIATISFLANTYILMLVGGGQIQLGLSYAITPFIFLLFFSLFKKFRFSNRSFYLLSVITGITLSLQVLFDFRFTYITLVGLFIYSLFFFIENRSIVYNIWKYWKVLLGFAIALFLPILLHAFWILPTVIIHQNPLQQLGTAYSTQSAVQYFSFAKFEDAMGLLHPNWPENIFGFTHFMRPEFLLLPILAFGSLLFVDLKNKKTQENKFVLFFALLGLIGIFLAKGANDPFGGVYLWMFGHIPGFMMFRDPTKWYVLIALSYAVLIPYTVGEVYEWVKKRDKFLIFNFQFLTKSKFFNLQNAFLIFIFGYLLFLIRPALFGQLGGTFKAHTLPQEYVTLEKYLSSQQNFSRVMWIPSLERFGYYSATHPAVGAEEFYHVTSTSGVLTNVQKQATEKNLQTLSVKYIIVPYDAEGELFVKDREYDNAQYIEAINALKKLPWLTEIPGFGRIHVFTLAHTKDHFWIQSDANAKVSYVQINPTKYSVQIKNAQKGDRLVFTDSFDSHWQMTSYGSKINSQPFGGLNSFVLPKGGNFTASLYYTPQDLVNIGLVISGVTVIVLLGYFSFYFLSSKKEKFFRDTSAK